MVGMFLRKRQDAARKKEEALRPCKQGQGGAVIGLKRYTAAALLLALLVLPACAAKDGSTDRTTPSGEQSGSSHVSEYILVRGDDSGNAVLRQVLKLKYSIDSRFGTNVLSSTDWAVDAEKEELSRRREILVGVTNREESVEANKALEGIHGYVIRSVGDKIVITASTTGLLSQAVERFTREYIEKGNGKLPRSIDVEHSLLPPLCVMSEPSCMKLLLPASASPGLVRAAGDFSDRIAELSGQFPQVEKSAELTLPQIVFSFKDSVFRPAKKPSSKGPEAEGSGMWSVAREGDLLILEAEDELRLIAGLGTLYEHFGSHVDYTLDSQAAFFYEEGQAYRESWEGVAPRVIGATYLGNESVSVSAQNWYYEDVSLNAFCSWKLLLVEEGMGSWIPQGETINEATFLNAEENVEISAWYDRESRTLTVSERVCS